MRNRRGKSKGRVYVDDGGLPCARLQEDTSQLRGHREAASGGDLADDARVVSHSQDRGPGAAGGRESRRPSKETTRCSAMQRTTRAYRTAQTSASSSSSSGYKAQQTSSTTYRHVNGKNDGRIIISRGTRVTLRFAATRPRLLPSPPRLPLAVGGDFPRDPRALRALRALVAHIRVRARVFYALVDGAYRS